MKPRLLALALVLLPLCFSCRKDGKDPDTLKGFTLDKASSERLHQSLPADATGAASVTFEAPSSWRASARETRSVSWLTVEPDHGEAGTATVSFTMDPNGEPAARTAEVTFSCEGGSFTMTITQEGQSAVEPSGQEKHPFVAPGKRMSYAAQLDDTGQESSIYAFAYSDDGKVSKIRSYENVQDGLCHPGYTSVIDFTRTGETVRFEWIENRMTGAQIPFDEDGTVTIGGKNAWYMMGHALWDEAFSRRFLQILDEEYDRPETAGKLWEQLYREHLDVLKLKIRRYAPGVIYEFDTLDELRTFDASYVDDTRSALLKEATAGLGIRERDIVHIRAFREDTAEAAGFEFDSLRGHYRCRYESGRPVRTEE